MENVKAATKVAIKTSKFPCQRVYKKEGSHDVWSLSGTKLEKKKSSG